MQKNKVSLSKKSFVKVIQSLNLTMGQDDILLVYNHFDEAAVGEISMESFLEKFESIALSSLQKLQKSNDKEAENVISTSKISTKQQIVAILQKIYLFFIEKKYNKKQMLAVFDRNGNGILNREDFLQGIKNLNLNITIEKARVLMDFLDSNDNGLIEVDEFIGQLYQSIPQSNKFFLLLYKKK